jgi:type IV pilus assembly protein PilQ
MRDSGRIGTAVFAGILAAALGSPAETAPRPTAKPSPPKARAAKKPAPILRKSRPAPAVLPLPPGGALLLGEEKPRYSGEPISLDLKDADIKDVLLTFSKLTGMNMVIDPEVKGSVTVRLENVPWDQALEVILRVNGLGYVLEGNITRVGPPGKLD